MILTTVKTTKSIEENNNIIISPQGIEIYHFTDFVFYKNDLKQEEDDKPKIYSLLPLFLDLYHFRVLKRIVVTNKISISDEDTEKEEKEEKETVQDIGKLQHDTYSKVVSSKAISLEIYKQLTKLRNERKLRGVGLISTVTQNSTRNSTLFDLSSIMFKLSQRYSSFNNKTDEFLDNVSKMTKTKITKKVLIITTTTSCHKPSSFIKSLYKELISKRKSHSINNYDYVIFSLFHSKTLEHIETTITNTERFTYLLRAVSILLSNSIAHSKLTEENIQEITEEIKDNIKKISNTDEAENITDKLKKAVKRSLFLATSLDTKKDIKNFTKYIINKLTDKEETEDLEEIEIEDNYSKVNEEVTEDDEALLSTTSENEKKTKVEVYNKVTDKEIKQELENLLKLKFEPIKVSVQNTPKKTMSDILSVKEISNVHTSHINSFEIIKSTLSMYNKTYWKKIGYNVEIDDVKLVSNGTVSKPSYLQEATLKINYGKKTQTAKVFLPDFSDNGITWVSNTPRVLINQLYTLPIVTLEQGKVLFKTMYSSLLVSLLTKNKVTYYESYIMGKKLPIFLIMVCLRDIDTIFSSLEIKGYKIVNASNINDYKNEYIKIRISEDAYIVINTSKIHKHQLFFINTIKQFVKMYDVTKFKYFGNNDFWNQVVLSTIQPKLYHFIKNMDSIFIDPFTRSLLKHYSLPTNIYDILLYMIYATMDASVSEENDISMKRLRNHEIISILLFKNINSSLLAHATKIKSNISIPKDCIINDLLMGESESQFQMVQQDYNPLFYASSKTKVTYKGLDGIKNVNNNIRNLHPSMMCLIDPVDTSENASVGETQHLTIDAKIDNIFGKLNYSNCNGLSITTSILPFHKSNDGNRVQMSDTQIKQSLPLQNSERPLVSTGFESLVSRLTSGIFIVRSNVDGEVVEVNEKMIIIQDDKKKKHVYILGPQYTTQTRITQTPIVKVGDIVKKGQIIAENKSFFDNGFYKFGVNARVAYMNYLGYGIEDGLIISESFAKKLASIKSVSPDLCTIEIANDAKIIYVRDKKGEVKKGEDLVILNVKKDLYKNIVDIGFQAVVTYENENVVVKLKAQKDGVIDDIEVYKSKDGIHEGLKKLYHEFATTYETKEDTPKIQHYYSTTREKFLHEKVVAEKPQNNILIYRITYVQAAVLGDKLTNRHAAKGIISLILPDDKMPRDEEGPFDMIYNPYSILGRKNVGQLIELWLGECIRKINNMIKQYYESGKTDEIIKLIMNSINILVADKKHKQHLIDFFSKNTKEILQDIAANGFSFPVGVNNEVTLQNVIKLMKHLNVSGLKKVYVPELGSYTKQECNCGTLYITKLQQKVETKYRQRSIGLYDFKSGQAIHGRKLEGGSKIGEYDCYSLISHNAENVIKELYTVMSDDHESKYKLINNIVEKGSCKLKDLHIKSTSSNLAMLYLAGLHSIEI